MARSILKSLSPSMAPTSTPGDNQPAGHDISAVAGCIIGIVFLICIIINFVLRLFLASKYNQRLQRQANAATSAKLKLGLLPEEISLLPKFVYHPSKNYSAVDCSVCINELVDGEIIRVLPTCKHFFHIECIDKWLCTNSSCPMCRAHPEPEKVKLGLVSVSPALPQLTMCTLANEQGDLDSFNLENPPETTAQLDSQSSADLHEIRVEVQLQP